MDSKNKKNSRIGQTKRMNSGDYATIIAYNNANDITVKIGNIIVEHTKYQHFCDGQIKVHVMNFNSHLGETKRMNNGQLATLIRSNSYYDIDIQFDDGTIVCTTYPSFKSGATHNPNNNCYTRRMEQKKNIPKLRIGETKQMNSGDVATIIAYRSCSDMDIQFENGNILNGVSYYRFKNGVLKNKQRRKNT